MVCFDLLIGLRNMMSRYFIVAALFGVYAALQCQDGECNVAIGGLAEQNSVGWGGWPFRAIDGSTSGVWRHRSCTHSRFDKDNWWSVKLAGYIFRTVYPVDRVIVHNRQDCCSDRITGAMVYTKNGDAEPELCGKVETDQSSITVDCAGKLATDIVIKQDSNFLTLCEVQVMVKETDLPESDYVNVALEGSASQSSIGWNGQANRAIDGNTNGQWSGQSCTHTLAQASNKWSVLLPQALFGAKYPVSKIVIYNRQDCCEDRIKSAKVWVDNEMCGQVQYQPGKSIYIIDCGDKIGSKVSVTLDKQYLTLCEVEVYVPKDKAKPKVESYVNVAKDGEATQSSMGWGGLASRGIDGNTDPIYRSNSCTHSRYDKDNRWTLALAGSDVGIKYPVSKIIIYNRLDCCSNRINGTKVWLDDNMIGQVKYDGSPIYSFDVTGQTGGVITVQNDNSWLTLCEVEVYVKEDSIPKLPEITNVALGETASQSSEGWGGKAERAIDGNTSGIYNRRSCTHSRFSKNNSWRVELTKTVEVTAVKIYNRIDCCQDRINGTEVYVGDVKCGTVQFNFASTYVIPCAAGTVASQVKIIQKNNILTLCEVEVLVAEEPGTELVDEE